MCESARERDVVNFNEPSLLLLAGRWKYHKIANHIECSVKEIFLDLMALTCVYLTFYEINTNYQNCTHQNPDTVCTYDADDNCHDGSKDKTSIVEGIWHG